MKTSSKIRLVALSFLLAVQMPVVAADKKQNIRPDVAKPLQEAQKALQAKQYPEANAALTKAAAVSKLTPYESYVIARLKSSAALGTNDYPAAVQAYEQVVNSPELPAEEKVSTLESYVKLSYATKDYARTADAVQKYRAAGGSNPEVLGLYAQSLYLAGRFREASVELTNQINAGEAAGKRPTDTQLQLLASCALKQNDMVAYAAALEKMVIYTPKKEYWLDLIVRTAGKPGFSEKLDLDVYRLRRSTGTMEKAGEYMDAAQLGLTMGFPGEAQSFIDEGYRLGLLGTGPDAARQKALKDLIGKKTSEDKATLAEADKAAAKQPTGDALVSTGYNYVAYGQADKGIPLMEQGIAKGGLKLADQAKLHLGYAYLLARKKDQAMQTFASVAGTDGSKDLARLWILQAKGPAPAAPAAAAPAAPAPAK